MQTAMIIPKNTLDAQRMNKLHQEIEGAELTAKEKELTAKEKAAELGDMLIAKKAELKHGEFMPWVEANCSFKRQRAQDYMKVAKAKYQSAGNFARCESIAAVLALGKKPKAPKPTFQPTTDDLKTMANLKTLAERGATEGERTAAQSKLDAYASAFGDAKDEVIEKAAEVAQEDEFVEPDSVIIDKFHRRLKRKDQDWLIDQLLWAMHRDHEIFKTIAERLFDQ